MKKIQFNKVLHFIWCYVVVYANLKNVLANFSCDKKVYVQRNIDMASICEKNLSRSICLSNDYQITTPPQMGNNLQEILDVYADLTLRGDLIIT